MAVVPPANSPISLTKESISSFLRQEEELGASIDALRQRKCHVTALYDWLQGKPLTYKNLRDWRQSLVDKGYVSITVLNYIKSVNRYLDFAGMSDLRFSKGKPKDLTNQQFGFLTALSPTNKRDRGDIVWECKCQCGKIIELPATRLLTGNTASCGCLLLKHLQAANQYIANTSIRSALEDNPISERSASGYTGVTPKRGKWQAHITYKGKHYTLGTYAILDDAVKARARAKKWVREDAMKLLEAYEQLHKDDPDIPKKQKKSRANIVSTMQINAERTFYEYE